MQSGALNISGVEYMTIGEGSVSTASYTQSGGTVIFNPR